MVDNYSDTENHTTINHLCLVGSCCLLQAALGVFGHGGADYASSAYECGYNPSQRYGISLMMTSNLGLNCSVIVASDVIL
jgi:hypothetical protein